MKVQFGCGGNKLDGWVNHDIEVDISKPLPYGDSSIEMVFMEHCWEHITPHEALRCLDECRRILIPGGRIRLCVPVIDNLFCEHGRDIVFGHGHLGVYTETSVFHMLRLAGFDPSLIMKTKRSPLDHHWTVIGREKDDIETARFEAIK